MNYKLHQASCLKLEYLRINPDQFMMPKPINRHLCEHWLTARRNSVRFASSTKINMSTRTADEQYKGPAWSCRECWENSLTHRTKKSCDTWEEIWHSPSWGDRQWQHSFMRMNISAHAALTVNPGPIMYQKGHGTPQHYCNSNKAAETRTNAAKQTLSRWMARSCTHRHGRADIGKELI